MKKGFSIIIGVIYCMVVHAQTPLSLEQAIKTAIANSLAVEIAKVDQQIAANNNTWQAAGKHPTISAGITSSNVAIAQDNPTSFLGKATILNNSLDGNLDVAINLYDGGRIKINKALFERQALLTDNALKQNLENVIQSVLSAYYQAQILKEQIKTFDEILSLSKDRIAYQNIRKEFGQAGTFDILQTKDALLNDSTNYLVTLNNYESAIRTLKLAMGEVESNVDYDVSDPLSYTVRTLDETAMADLVMEQNTAIQSLNLNRDLAIAQTELQKTVKRPTIGLNLGVNASLFGADLFGDSDFARMINYTLGNSYGPYANISARYTISDGNNMQRNIDNAMLEERIATLSIADQKRNLNNQIQQAVANYRHQLEIIDLTVSLLENSKRNLEIAEERFKAAQITSFDYRTIQLSYLNANVAKLNSIFNLKVAEIELDRLTGDLISYQ